MSAVLIALLIGLGGGAWLYNRFMNSTGNNTRNSLMAAALCGGLIFLVVYIGVNYAGGLIAK